MFPRRNYNSWVALVEKVLQAAFLFEFYELDPWAVDWTTASRTWVCKLITLAFQSLPPTFSIRNPCKSRNISLTKLYRACLMGCLQCSAWFNIATWRSLFRYSDFTNGPCSPYLYLICSSQIYFHSLSINLELLTLMIFKLNCAIWENFDQPKWF